jgi:hypothetical protein
MEQKHIVAERMLNMRLARIEARPGYLAVYATIAGVIGGAFLCQPTRRKVQALTHALRRRT